MELVVAVLLTQTAAEWAGSEHNTFKNKQGRNVHCESRFRYV